MLKKLTIFLLISIIILLIAFLSLPLLIDRLVLPSMLARTPFSFSRASMSRITPYLAEGSVEIREGETPVISIPRFQIRFTPRALLNRKISSLTVAHATLHFQREHGRLVLPGFKPQIDNGASTNSGSLFFLPLGVEALILDQCLIVIHESGRPPIHLGVSGQLAPTFNADGAVRRLTSLTGSLFLSDDISAAVTAAATLNDNEVAVNLRIDNGAAALPRELLRDGPRLPRFTSLSAELELVADAASFALKRYRAAGSFTGLHYDDEHISFSGGQTDKTLNFSLSGTRDSHAYRLDAIAVESPIDLTATIAGEARRRDGQINTSGSAAAFWQPPGLAGTDTIPLSLSFDAIWSESSGATLVIEGGCDSDLELKVADGWSLSGLAGLQFYGSLDSTSQQLQADLKITSGPLQAHGDVFLLTTSDLDLEAELTRSSDQFDLRIMTAVEQISLPEQNLTAKNIVLDLPLSPNSTTGVHNRGALQIETVEMRGAPLFSMAAELANRGLEYATEGALELFGSSDIRIPFSGSLKWPGRTGRVAWDLVTEAIDPGTLPSFLPLPDDFDFSGRLAASGSMDFNPGFKAQAQAALTDARIEFNGVVMEDLDCAIDFPELPRLQSGPSQNCSIGALDISTLHFSDVSLTYRVENPQTVFIERSKLRWCGGTLESGSLRLSSQLPEIDTTFYCSRIGLAELLDQFGFKGTEGEGSLNGTLPVILSRQRLVFDDGFLFSTPGTGGIVRFSDTDLLRQGVGTVSEAGFLNYTLQALEDFTYNWTKLSFNSEGDDLLLTLELDGKPSTALPFKFDNKGTLIESKQGQGLQYPIRLEVNFRVPLADLFQVGRSLNSIMGNGK